MKKFILKKISLSNISIYNEDIKELLLQNYHINFPNTPNISKIVNRDLDKIYMHCNDENTLIVGIVFNKKLIAFVWSYHRVVLDSIHLHISHIVVNSLYQNLGLGSRLLLNMEEYAKNNSINVIDLYTSINNLNALSFYEKNDYKQKRILLEKELNK